MFNFIWNCTRMHMSLNFQCGLMTGMIAVSALALIWTNTGNSNPVKLQVSGSVSQWQSAEDMHNLWKINWHDRNKQDEAFVSYKRIDRSTESCFSSELRPTTQNTAHCVATLWVDWWVLSQIKGLPSKACGSSPVLLRLTMRRERQRSNDDFWFMDEQINCSWHSAGQAIFHTMG
jgi:hypothetical protein